MAERDPSSGEKPAGISLDELPDQHANDAAPAASAKRKKKPAVDPRLNILARLNDEEKVLAMTRWHEFDRKEPRFDKLLLTLIPVGMKYGGFFPFVRTLLKGFGDANIMGAMMMSMVANVESVFQYAELISAALIFIFPPIQATRLRFLLGFEGVDIPRKLRTKGAEVADRVRVKWDQIGGVEPSEGPVAGLEILNHSRMSLGQLRWDLKLDDKYVVLKLLQRFTSEEHPLRRYVEQELDREE